MNKIYIVDHIHEYYRDPKDPQKKYLDLKGIGNFYSLKEAKHAIAKCKVLKGFKEHPDGFRITEFILNSIYSQQVNLLFDDKLEEKKPKKIFSLYYIMEDEEGEEVIILLGIFTSRKNAVNARKAVLINTSLKHLSSNLQIFEESVNKINWEEGFINWEKSIRAISEEL